MDGAASGVPAGADVEIVVFGNMVGGGATGWLLGDALDPDAFGDFELVERGVTGVVFVDFLVGVFAILFVDDAGIERGDVENVGMIFEEEDFVFSFDAVGIGTVVDNAGVDNEGILGAFSIIDGFVAIFEIVEGRDDVAGVFEGVPEFDIVLAGGAKVAFGEEGIVNKADGFGLGVDFVAGHGDFEGNLGAGETGVHDADGEEGDYGEDGDGNHGFDDGVAAASGERGGVLGGRVLWGGEFGGVLSGRVLWGGGAGDFLIEEF